MSFTSVVTIIALVASVLILAVLSGPFSPMEKTGLILVILMLSTMLAYFIRTRRDQVEERRELRRLGV